MPDDERNPLEILQDVNHSELGQISPGYSPYNPDLQSWNRGRALGRSGDSYQTQTTIGQPEFTARESGDLSVAAREAAVNLGDYPDITKEYEEAKQRNMDFTATKASALKTQTNNKNTPNLHENDNNLEHDKANIKEQGKENDRGR